MRKLLLTPNQSGYVAEDGVEALSAALDGGPSRTRRDFVGAVARVNCTWNLPPTEYQYMKAFLRTATAQASTPFYIDLILDEPELLEYTAKFIPGTFRLTGVRGLTTSVSAQLEVRPRPVDEVYDEAILDNFESYGGDDGQATIYQLLSDLVNISLPEAMPGA
jgi:hypothetical protein